ncbi:zinc metalloprotease HtpX [Candidatus Kaiserbacteria bacterium RIFCSPHIGHO2_01_FULL_54_36]|uniref:Protease HtpX homolog n=1 Tax=Candidatus Kaiserbacteria bacterium RIFCSPHIGHO2_01_FULL_54_36 TaxID=1798482 RepID=A0A1F6CL91_9BACT|nr:MAG: zinc metalloprotease HtpX [Candidatus Kaiserbacteria bacterium RIFCSPHIGHO2_01_FULL_54_36]OGG75376.1 MAG: zinc metalloprotease HtpX [Candidatus Kaiserbacteria bacterium RIFCSPLOWO2_01_FULL_54_22]
MASLYTQQGKNIRKTWFLMAGFLVIVIALGWIVSQLYGNTAILYAAVAFSLVMNITAYWFSDKIALSATGAKEADPVEYLELHRIVENLAITAGLPKPRVYVMQEPAPNAFAAGRDPKHAVVAVTTGLLERLDRSELEGVLAHELSHIGNRDILVMTVAVVLAGFIAIVSDIFLRMSFFGGGNRDNKNPLLLVAGIAAIILAPIAAQLIQLAVSRKREFLADASGALLTRYPDALASALQKIASYGAPMQKANHATAHLFISNPFGAHEAGRFIAKLFSTHPPVEERVAALTQMRV